MAAIASLSDLVNRLSGGNSGTPDAQWWYKAGRISGTADTAPVAGRWHSMWRYDGIPSGGSAPGAVAAPDNTTAGSFQQASPGGGRQKWLVGGASWGGQPAAVLLYDRLLHIGGLSGTVTTAQAVGGTLTRNTGGVGNQIWVEVYTAIGGTATTITASYTNQAGTSGRTTVAASIGATGRNESSRMIQLPLQSGDTGVQAVASVTLAASTGTAGNFGVTVVRPLAYYPGVGIGVGSWQSHMDGIQIPEVASGACLALAYYSSTTNAIEHQGCLSMVEA